MEAGQDKRRMLWRNQELWLLGGGVLALLVCILVPHIWISALVLAGWLGISAIFVWKIYRRHQEEQERQERIQKRMQERMKKEIQAERERSAKREKLLEEKYSSREKKIDFHVVSVQIVQEIKGIIRLLKVILEKENSNWDKVKEQNDEYKAETGFTDRKIKAYDKLELTDEQQKVLDALRQNCVEETLWSAIAAFQNYPFRTASGLPYQYKLKIGKDGTYNKELLIDRRENSKTLSWSSIKMAFQNCRQISGIVKRPKALGDIRGISYIYPLFWKFGLIEVPEETVKKMSGECDTEAEL